MLGLNGNKKTHKVSTWFCQKVLIMYNSHVSFAWACLKKVGGYAPAAVYSIE